MSTALERFSRKNQFKRRRSKDQFHSGYLASPEEFGSRVSRCSNNNSSLIFSRLKSNSVPFEIPNLTPRLLAKEEETLNNVYKRRKFNSRHQYELLPLKRPEHVRLLKPMFGSQNLNEFKMPSSRPRITDKYQFQIENIKLVERLLSVKPSKEVCKSEQLLFYKEHKKNVANLEMRKNHSVSVVGNKSKKKKKRPWVFI